MYLSSRWIHIRVLTRNMLTNNISLPFVPAYNESHGHNAIIEWQNWSTPAVTMMKFPCNTTAIPRYRFEFSGNSIAILVLLLRLFL